MMPSESLTLSAFGMSLLVDVYGWRVGIGSLTVGTVSRGKIGRTVYLYWKTRRRWYYVSVVINRVNS